MTELSLRQAKSIAISREKELKSQLSSTDGSNVPKSKLKDNTSISNSTENDPNNINTDFSEDPTQTVQ